MRCLVQKNIWGEYGYDRFFQSLQAVAAITEVDIIPFTDQFVQTYTEQPDYCFGSTRFIQVCRAKCFPTFPSFDPIETFYPIELWINGQGVTLPLRDIKITSPQFIKPYTEKFFTGTIVEKQSDLDKLQLSTSFIEDEGAELIRVSEPVTILNEARFFIINEEVITGSYYRINRQRKTKAIYSDPVWQHVKDIIQAYGSIADGFVMDMGETSQGWKILELNNLNSAGIYACNTDAIVRALQLSLRSQT